MLVQVAVDFPLDGRLQVDQQKAQPRLHVDGLPVHPDPAVHAAALEMDFVPVPAVIHAEFLGQVLGNGIGGILSLLQALAVLAVDVDMGHGGMVNRIAGSGGLERCHARIPVPVKLA